MVRIRRSVPISTNNVLFNLPYESGKASGSAFEKHSGRGVRGELLATPFSQFWFDDNYLTAAYGAFKPDGLYNSSTRWQIMGLNANGWPSPTGKLEPDEWALMGLYHISKGDPASALKAWNSVWVMAGTDYDSKNLRHTYPELLEAYYIGLFKVLTDRLMDLEVSASDQLMLIQHSISLRSNIISGQQLENGTLIGWITGRFDNSSLMYTESISILVLALGAGARFSFEAGVSPKYYPSSFSLLPHNVLSPS